MAMGSCCSLDDGTMSEDILVARVADNPSVTLVLSARTRS